MNKELIFQNIPDKREYKNTTSLKFKEDLLSIFEELGQEYTCLEVGTNHGHTTRILSFIFKDVITLDWHEEPNLRMAKELCHDRNNIKYIEKDVYASSWEDLNLPKYNVSFIDCGHEYPHVISDIKNCITYGAVEQYLIFDDYGQADGSIKNAIKDSNLTISRYIGEYNGFTCKNLSGKEITFVAREGVICNMS